LPPVEPTTPEGPEDRTALDLAAYRLWVSGDLVGNGNRGVFAEWLVGMALGVFTDRDRRIEWDAVDLRYEGLRIEIKTSAYSLSWDLDSKGVPRFGIEPQSFVWCAHEPEGWELTPLFKGCEIIDRRSGKWARFDPPRRTADVYVFCLNTSMPATTDKVADPNEWQFWVVPTPLLDARHPTQKTAGERTLDRLVDPIRWHGLKVAVDACRQ